MKKSNYLTICVLIASFFAFQHASAVYAVNTKPAPDHKDIGRSNKLINTKLQVSFDYQKHYLFGKEWITLTPTVAATDSLYLDAKGMEINNLSIAKNGKEEALKYSYDGNKLKIKLNKLYSPRQHYTVYLNYVAKPDEAKVKNYGRIPEVRGLYFINTRGEDKKKPVEIWTQGEPEGSSVWFPTIDRPDQKTLEEISITVPDQYVTLSNGRLIGKQLISKGLRTDTWKMEKPHAPYLFMMAVGDFKIYKDKSKQTEVNYYLEKSFAPYARAIFGNTPQMIDFYANRLGVKYPWNKYSQVVVRDYNSGAMENTSATLLGEQTQKTDREIADESYEDRESTIAHELFHQWFGDYVTCKDWADITVNESMACWSESLWAAYKYGNDAGDAVIYHDGETYFGVKDADKKALVRENFESPQQVFDEVTYQKGACILNMLRNYLGDAAFFKGLHLYLTKNAYKAAGVADLQYAFEQAANKKLNWFFKQWYYKAGNPILKIAYQWNESTKTEKILLQQTQQGDAFLLPLSVDIYINKKVQHLQALMHGKTDTLTFKLTAKPELVNADGSRTLLALITDNKGIDEYIAQYYEAAKFADRIEAINYLSGKQDSTGVGSLMISALSDKNYELRCLTIRNINLNNPDIKQRTIGILNNIITNDKSPIVVAEAIKKLGSLKDSLNYPLFVNELHSRSYNVEAAALTALGAINPAKAIELAKPFENDNGGNFTMAIVKLYANAGSEDQLPFIANAFDESTLETRFDIAKDFTILLVRIDDTRLVKANVEKVKNLAIEFKKFGVDKYAIRWLTELQKHKQQQAGIVSNTLKEQLTAQVNFISSSVEEIKNAKIN